MIIHIGLKVYNFTSQRALLKQMINVIMLNVRCSLPMLIKKKTTSDFDTKVSWVNIKKVAKVLVTVEAIDNGGKGILLLLMPVQKVIKMSIAVHFYV